MNLADIGTRLLVATLIGCTIGLNRFAHHRFIGVRTLGLVSLGAAGLVLAALETGSGTDQLAAVSRIIQGINYLSVCSASVSRNSLCNCFHVRLSPASQIDFRAFGRELLRNRGANRPSGAEHDGILPLQD